MEISSRIKQDDAGDFKLSDDGILKEKEFREENIQDEVSHAEIPSEHNVSIRRPEAWEPKVRMVLLEHHQTVNLVLYAHLVVH